MSMSYMPHSVWVRDLKAAVFSIWGERGWQNTLNRYIRRPQFSAAVYIPLDIVSATAFSSPWIRDSPLNWTCLSWRNTTEAQPIRIPDAFVRSFYIHTRNLTRAQQQQKQQQNNTTAIVHYSSAQPRLGIPARGRSGFDGMHKHRCISCEWDVDWTWSESIVYFFVKQ